MSMLVMGPGMLTTISLAPAHCSRYRRVKFLARHKFSGDHSRSSGDVCRELYDTGDTLDVAR